MAEFQQTPAPVMTLQELQSVQINAEVAREAHTQVQKRLEDALATKASHEQKAFAVLATHTTVALALFAGFRVLGAGAMHEIAPAFLLSGAVFAVGAMLAGVALLPTDYGALGSDPSVWLRPGLIDGDESALAASLAYEAFFHRDRISHSEKANKGKALLIRVAIICGVTAPLALGVGLWLLG